MVASQTDHRTTEYVDIAVYSEDGKLQLVVEVKNKLEATVDWAAVMRRNLIAHVSLPTAPFFLLALPDHFYLWKNAGSLNRAVPPDYDVDPTPLLSAYVNGASSSLRSLSGNGLALAVSAWLTNLVNATSKQVTSPHQKWLHDSGLYSAIRSGTVRLQDAS